MSKKLTFIPESPGLKVACMFCGAFLLGVFTVLIGFVIWITITKRHTMRRTHRFLSLLSIVMYLLASLAFGAAVCELSLENAPVGVIRAHIILGLCECLIGDLVLVWRLWAIWSYNYWIAVCPFMLALAATGFALGTQVPTLEVPNVVHVTAALLLVSTSICTILIAGRILYIRSKAKQIGGIYYARFGESSSYTRAALLIIETGSLFTIVLFITVVLVRTGNPGYIVPIYMELMLVGILPTLIIVVVQLEKSPSSDLEGQDTTTRPVEFKTRINVTTETKISLSPSFVSTPR